MRSLRPSRPGRSLVIAHRGASGDAPENTLAAFRLAMEQGADMIELDVQLSADGHLVVIHDPTVDRTTDGRGLVSDLTLEQIKALDAGSGFSPAYAGEKVPTLDEVLDWAASRIPLAIEIKNGPIYYSGIESKIVDALRSHDAAGSCLVISFDHNAVLRVKQLSPETATGVLFACCPVSPASLAAAARADVLLPHWSNLTPEMVRSVHSRGLAVSPWVIDDEREMRRALSLGVDGVATNYPGKLASLVETSLGRG